MFQKAVCYENHIEDQRAGLAVHILMYFAGDTCQQDKSDARYSYHFVDQQTDAY